MMDCLWVGGCGRLGKTTGTTSGGIYCEEEEEEEGWEVGREGGREEGMGEMGKTTMRQRGREREEQVCGWGEANSHQICRGPLDW